MKHLLTKVIALAGVCTILKTVESPPGFISNFGDSFWFNVVLFSLLAFTFVYMLVKVIQSGFIQRLISSVRSGLAELRAFSRRMAGVLSYLESPKELKEAGESFESSEPRGHYDLGMLADFMEDRSDDIVGVDMLMIEDFGETKQIRKKLRPLIARCNRVITGIAERKNVKFCFVGIEGPAYRSLFSQLEKLPEREGDLCFYRVDKRHLDGVDRHFSLLFETSDGVSHSFAYFKRTISKDNISMLKAESPMNQLSPYMEDVVLEHRDIVRKLKDRIREPGTRAWNSSC